MPGRKFKGKKRHPIKFKSKKEEIEAVFGCYLGSGDPAIKAKGE